MSTQLNNVDNTEGIVIMTVLFYLLGKFFILVVLLSMLKFHRACNWMPWKRVDIVKKNERKEKRVDIVILLYLFKEIGYGGDGELLSQTCGLFSLFFYPVFNFLKIWV